jgi:MFS family permease
MFVGFSAPFCGQLNLNQQAALYHKTTVQITYFNSAASAGLATGGYVWWPLSHKFGRSSVIFWCLVGVLVAQIWAPLMTRPDQYAPELVSRYFAAFFGVSVSVLGPRYLVDMFFLHQRGRAFTVLHLALNFGASAGPTFSGFIAANQYWPVEYWWSVGLTAFTLIPVFLFLEDTTYDRSEGAVNRVKPASFLRDRFETFFPGHKVVPHKSWRETVRLDLLFFSPLNFGSANFFSRPPGRRLLPALQVLHRAGPAHHCRLRHHQLWFLRGAQRLDAGLAAAAQEGRRHLRLHHYRERRL